MAAQQWNRASRPPPDPPSTVDGPTADYLRRLSTWTQAVAGETVPSKSAVGQVYLMAPNGTVWALSVSNAGAAVFTSVPLGSNPP